MKNTDDWSTPTAYMDRFMDALTRLCGGVRPDHDVCRDWLDHTSEELQQWAIQNGPTWVQGIGVIDAAIVLANTPTEGAAHERAPVVQEPGLATAIDCVADSLKATAKTLHGSVHVLRRARIEGDEQSLRRISATLRDVHRDWCYDMTSAPVGELVALLIPETGEHALEDTAGPSRTVGAYITGDDLPDRWIYARWDWSQDCYVGGIESSMTSPIAWAHLLPRPLKNTRGTHAV